MASEKLDELIIEKARAGYPALYLISSEDLRCQKEIKKAAETLKRGLYLWTFGTGLVKDGSRVVISGTEDPVQVLKLLAKSDWSTPAAAGRTGSRGSATENEKAIVILRLFNHFIKDPMVQATLLDLTMEFKQKNRMLIILTPVLDLPAEIEKEFALIETPLPTKQDLELVLDGIINGTKLTGNEVPSPEIRKHIVESAMGLTTSEAENAISLAYVRPRIRKQDKKWDPVVVMDEKCAALRKTGLLEYIPSQGSGLTEIGGMSALKEWVRKRKKAFTPEAAEFGLRAPKGVLLVGPPGSGKSLGAKAIAAELELPLLKCDMGRMFGSLVGESERNIRKAIQIAEAVAPCVFWIDEIEKGLAGASGQGDSGVGARVLGTILTWMQEKKAPVFVYATANDVSRLPPELLRKGRFDEMFSVLLPNEEERKEIFRIHLAKRGREKLIGKNKIDIEEFAKDTNGYSGAEIEASIEEALMTAFSNGRELSSVDLDQAVGATTPLSVTMRAQLIAIEEWCKSRVRPANGDDKSTVNSIIPEPGGRMLQA